MTTLKTFELNLQDQNPWSTNTQNKVLGKS